MGTWEHGNMGTWEHADIATCGYGDMARWSVIKNTRYLRKSDYHILNCLWRGTALAYADHIVLLAENDFAHWRAIGDFWLMVTEGYEGYRPRAI
jgi:hypothetical protein